MRISDWSSDVCSSDLGYDASKWAVFNIAIQPGAILAIVVLYRHLFWDMFVGFFRRNPVALAFVRNLLLAFFPAVILGLAFGDQLEMLLENVVVVAWALVIGGFGILIVSLFAHPSEIGGDSDLSARTRSPIEP